jgi:hypothetical protein
MEALDGKTTPLNELFSQRFFFRIPEYQRPFRWDQDNLSDLIDDLMDAPRDREYFLGTLVLHRREETTYDVVDGQQRLTALCILLACIRDCPALSAETDFRKKIHEKIFQERNELDGVPERNRVQVRDQSLYNRVIGTFGGAQEWPPDALPTKPSEWRYKTAMEIFTSRLSGLSDAEAKDLASFITRRCVFIYLATSSFDDAFRLFEIVNDRGKPLRRIDILKSMNLSAEVIPNEASRVRYALEWEEMEEQLGESRFEAIFHLLRLIYLRAKPQGDLLKEFKREVFGKKGMPKLGREFIDTLASYVELYDSLFLERDYLKDTGLHARFKTLMGIMISEFNASEWQACLLYFAKKFGRDAVYDYLLVLEKVYLQHWVSAMRKDERYSIYTYLLKAIDSSASAEAAIAAAEFNEEEIRSACLIPNFYGAGFCKYLLLRAEVLAGELDHARDFVARSVEHVLPQNPAPESEWASKFTQADVDEVVNTVGNLVLLTKAKNSTASRKDFAEKKKVYLKPRVSDFPRSIQVLGHSEWTRQVIEARTREFAERVLERP